MQNSVHILVLDRQGVEHAVEISCCHSCPECYPTTPSEDRPVSKGAWSLWLYECREIEVDPWLLAPQVFEQVDPRCPHRGMPLVTGTGKAYPYEPPKGPWPRGVVL